MNKDNIKIIESNIKAQLNKAPVTPICISGHPGTGKSTTVDIIAKQLDMNIVTCSGPVLSHEALSGLPDTVEAKQYQANAIDNCVPQATQWSIPEIMAQAIRAAEKKPTVLLIDDFHMVSPHLQAYFYGLLLERRLGNYKLSDNTAIVLTMNDSESAGFVGINSAVRNRLAILQVEFDTEYWLESYGNRLHYLVASFLKAKPSYCIEEESTGTVGYATARAWTAIASEIEYHTEEFINSKAYIIAGMQVSNEAAKAFQIHVNYISAINFTEVVSKRKLVDLSSKDPIDSIIYAYITNFVNTVDDGLYLFELMNKNIAQSAFIGFIIGELYTKYVNQDKAPLSEGLLFVIDKLLDNPMDKSKYEHTSLQKLKKVFRIKIDNLDKFMEKSIRVY